MNLDDVPIENLYVSPFFFGAFQPRLEDSEPQAIDGHGIA